MHAVQRIYKKYPKLFWLGSILILMVSISIPLSLLTTDEPSKIIVSDILSPLFNIFSTICLIAAAINSRRISRRLALGWSMLAVAQFTFSLGDIIWAVLELGLNSPTYPSIADAAYLLFYPLFLVGILFFPRKHFSPREWFKRAIDTTIIMVSAILGYWIFLIGPIINSEGNTPILEKILGMAYPIGDLIMLIAILVIIYYRSEKINLASFWILEFGTLVMIVSDSIFSYQSLRNIYESGGILDIGWLLSYMIIAAAGIFQAGIVRTYKESDTLPHKNLIANERISNVLSYIPYVAVAGAYYLLWTYHNSNLQISSDGLLAGVGCIIGLVIIRQIIALNENSDLFMLQSRTLMQVSSQASELDKTNTSLQQEIIERKRVELQLSHDALHDGLTDLANRALFMDRLRHAIEISKRTLDYGYSILYLDLDSFKSINDRLGHAAGDITLVEVSSRLINCTRSVDTGARFGGDEFVILLENASEPVTDISIANRILTEMERPIIVHGKDIFISCSVGIVQGISEYVNAEDIIRDADIAMYHAKEKGKSRYEIFNLALRTATLSRLEIENDLVHAIINDELFLNFQPIYGLKANEIVGFEALVRWYHPQRGLVMPSDFIKIAEESGLIIQLGDWVLREACSQLKQWQIQFSGSENLYVSVNISGKQINQKDFVHKVKETLDSTGLDAQRLKLEITENVFIESQSLVSGILSDLRKIGVAFFIDDFGTGYSSLSYLKNFPVNTIKIDRTFINDILEGKKGYEIVKTIIMMAQGMGIDTIAEGIENYEQLRSLSSLSCKYGQGNYLSKPEHAGLIEKILERQEGLQLNKLGEVPL